MPTHHVTAGAFAEPQVRGATGEFAFAGRRSSSHGFPRIFQAALLPLAGHQSIFAVPLASALRG